MYSFSITVEITFILPKLFLKKSAQKQLKFSNSIFLLYVKNSVTYHHLFFTYHSQMYFIKAFYCLLWPSIKKYLTKTFYYLFFPIITCRHLLLTYHSQKYFIKAFYCLLWPSIKKYLINSFYYLLFLIITCRHLLLTYHTQKYFIKAFYYLAKMWLLVT